MSKEEIIIDKIAIFGPHDRVNYGDFLFPIMLEYAVSKYLNKTIVLKKYSLIKSDYTLLGAFKSDNFRKLSDDINKDIINIIIVAGGECLAARWTNLYSYISPIYEYFYRIKILRNNRIFRNLPKFLLGGKTEYPFIINYNNYSNHNIKIIYNAVGGASGLSKQNIGLINGSLLVGLREGNSFNNITLKSKNNNVFLVPDSAIIISDVYKKGDINRLIAEDYIVFQLSNFKHQDKIDEIIEQLKQILETGIKIVFCPIGTAKGHEDHIILNYIYNLIKSENIIMIEKQPKILEIVSLIAFSKLYIGTSLHGVITSMSYGVPYIALNPNQEKMKSFIDTWSINELNYVCNTYDFFTKYKSIINRDYNYLISNNTEIMKMKYYNFIELMLKNI